MNHYIAFTFWYIWRVAKCNFTFHWLFKSEEPLYSTHLIAGSTIEISNTIFSFLFPFTSQQQCRVFLLFKKWLIRPTKQALSLDVGVDALCDVASANAFSLWCSLCYVPFGWYIYIHWWIALDLLSIYICWCEWWASRKLWPHVCICSALVACA